MTHAVANCYRSVVENFLRLPKEQRVPITFRHFEILAHLGRNPVSFSRVCVVMRLRTYPMASVANNVEDGFGDGIPC